MSTMNPEISENTTGNPLVPDGYDVFWSVLTLVAVVLLFVAFLRWYRTKSQLSTGEATVWFFVVFLVPFLGAASYLYRARTLRTPEK
ncbi:PLDc N-terminal domain-containing protein [Corynebacterium variabile]|uniref:PLDc N-terminal domain-containing protein n=1 Tax=Corynebacterium variabile TaxID=1727 RepID=UPI003BAF6B68